MPLSIDEAVRVALRLQPSLGVQVGGIQSQQGRTRQIGSAENPQIDLGGGLNWLAPVDHPSAGVVPQSTQTGIPAGVSTVYPVSLGAAARQLLYDFNQTRNLVKQSEALERSDFQTLTAAQQNLILNVRNAFYNYVNAIRVVHVDEANVANRQRQLDLASAQLRIGTGQPTDAITAQTNKSQGVLILNEARDQAEQARISLLQNMGVDPLTPVVPVEEMASGPTRQDAKQLTDQAIKDRPEVRSAAEALVAAKYGLSAAKATDLPALYAQAGIGAGGKGFPTENNVSNLGIGISFPLFDGGNRRGAVRAAKGEITISQSNLDSAILQVRADVASAYMALQSALQRVTIANNEALNAAEAVRVAEGRYKTGIGLFQDITTAQGLLLTAQTDQSTAQNSLDIARTNLRRAVGDLLHEIR